MGWIMLALVAAGTAVLLWRLGVPRLLWTSVATAIVLGAAGYAMQGTPDLPASPAKPQATAPDVSAEMIELRGTFFGRFTGDAAYQTAADAMLRANLPAAAVKVTLGGIDKNPKSPGMWTTLGSVLVAHDGGNVSPAALFAFRRAIQLAPNHPGPPFFLGLGLLQSGRLEEARKAWLHSLALTPVNASYRLALQERLALLDQFIAMSRAGAATASPDTQ